ncbi:MAG: Wzz/FepE/Etk N-terminal domain-containing protein [Chloroflexota bacterium]
MQDRNAAKSAEFEAGDVWALLFRNRWFIIIFTALGAIIASVVALLMPNWYSSTISAVPPKSAGQSDNVMGAVSSTLKDFGLQKLGGGGSDEYTFMVILTSRTVLDSLIYKYNLSKEYEIPTSEMELLRGAVQDNIEVALEREGNYVITIWDQDRVRAAQMANDYISMANNLAIKLFRDEAALSRTHFEERLRANDSMLAVIGDSLSKFTRRTMMFSPEAQATAVSSALADLNATAMQYDIMYDFYRKTYGEDDPMTIQQDKLRNEMRSKIRSAQNQPGFAGDFSVRNASATGIEYMRLYTEFETFSKVKSFLLPMMEKYKLDETRTLENLIIVDGAEPAGRKSKPIRSVIVIGSTLGAFVLAVIFIIGFNAWRGFKKKYSETAAI